MPAHPTGAPLADSTAPQAPLTRRRLLASLLALGLGLKGVAQSPTPFSSTSSTSTTSTTTSATSASAGQVLIIADEFPAMRLLAGRLMIEERIECKLVAQNALPADLAPFRAVIVYIHKELDEAVEAACIRYAEGGGRLILLHHSISSGKRKNKSWFKFLGVELPTTPFEQGGYKYYEDITLQIANLAPRHFITSNKIVWPERLKWPLAGQPSRRIPGLTLNETEVYLNHELTGEHTILLGFHYTDTKTHWTYEQSTAGWTRQARKGQVVYLMPGHSEREFKDPVYGRMVLNAVIWKP